MSIRVMSLVSVSVALAPNLPAISATAGAGVLQDKSILGSSPMANRVLLFYGVVKRRIRLVVDQCSIDWADSTKEKACADSTFLTLGVLSVAWTLMTLCDFFFNCDSF